MIPEVRLHGPRFWATTAVISGFGTSSLVLTGIAALLGIDEIPGLDKQWTTLLCFGIYMSALAAGFLGLFSMLACGVCEVGRISISGRLLPQSVLPAICIPLYLAPWAILLALWMFTR